MTEELLAKASRLQAEINNRKYNLSRIEEWDGRFKRMADDYYIIPEELQAEIAENVSQALKVKINLEIEELEKEFADL